MKLINKQPRRFFAFGCSFTSYQWTTWPEIIAEDLGIDEYHNLGIPGAGNELMFNRLMQADTLFKLDEQDLVMICWTNICREDRYVGGNWIAPGNIYSQKEYSDEFVSRYYHDPVSVALHDFAYIKASRFLLEQRGCQWHFMQMLDLVKFHDQWTSDASDLGNLGTIFATESMHILPSFYEVIWGENIEDRHAIEQQLYGKFDGHPSPSEHMQYLSKVFEHDWRAETLARVKLLEDEYHNSRLNNTGVFSHLRQPNHNDIL